MPEPGAVAEGSVVVREEVWRRAIARAAGNASNYGEQFVLAACRGHPVPGRASGPCTPKWPFFHVTRWDYILDLSLGWAGRQREGHATDANLPPECCASALAV